MSLDDKRTMLVPENQFGPAPQADFAAVNHEKNNLPDLLNRWHQRETSEGSRNRTEQSFFVPKEEIAENDYDLSINRYKEVIHEEIDYLEPSEVIASLRKIDHEIRAGLDELEGMLA